MKSREIHYTSKEATSLLDRFTPEQIEGGLVNYFLLKNNFVTKNKFLREVVEKDRGEVSVYLKELNKPLTLQDIEFFFEVLVPSKDKQLNGAIYTPSFIVDYITNFTIKQDGTVCDPSCGAGAFLVGSLKRLHKLTTRKYTDIIEKNLFGADLFDYCIRRTKIILTLYAVSNKEDPEDIRFNLVVKDSLNNDWEQVFPNVFENSHGFDFVVGNPPYVKIQDLDSALRRRLEALWETTGVGNFNLYFPFFELGVRLLKKGGLLGYIVPNNYFTSLAGYKLRGYLHRNKLIKRIINFNHLKLFQNAQTYTCITILTKAENENSFDYYYLADKSKLDSLDAIDFVKVEYDTLNDKKWRLMSAKDYENINRIERIGAPLGKRFKIRVGIATLSDKLFFVTERDDSICEAKVGTTRIPIERGATRKVVKISSIASEQDIRKDKLRIIFPYKKINGRYTRIPEDELKEKYPRCYAYLLAQKEVLKRRDKAKKSYVWYAYGRTQGLDFHGPRLYTRTFSNKPDFILDTEDNLFCNGYAVFINDRIRAYQALLNSTLMQYYVKKTSVEIEGDYQCYQKNFIEKFGIPEFSSAELDYLETEKNPSKLEEWLKIKYGIQF